MPHSHTTNTQIPVIDISTPSPEAAKQVLNAASTHGFLFIKNDGVTIPPKDIDAMFELSRQFFKSPREQKAEFAIHSDKAGGINKGWVSMQGESLDPEGHKQGDPKEAFNISLPHGPPTSPTSTLQPLPHTLSTSTPLITRFQTSCHTLCKSILSLLGTALCIPEAEWFAERHDQKQGASGSIFRMLYYPEGASKVGGEGKDEKTGKKIRAGAHSDYGSITLLFRLPGQGGLELLSSSPASDSGSCSAEEEKWIPVPVDPNSSFVSADLTTPPPILVNIGDLLSFWTNGMLKSTVHRVAFDGEDREQERYSLAYFCHPLDEVRLEAVPSSVIEEFGDKGVGELKKQKKRLGLGDGGKEEEEVLTAREHLERRLKVTYGL